MESVNFTSTMQPFFSLGASTKRERIAMLKKAFSFVAGDDLNAFINHFLTQTAFGRTEFLPVIQNQKLNGIIDNLKDLLKSSPQKHLPALRSLVTSSYSLQELIDMGFNITKSEFEYSRKINKNVSLNKKSQKNNNYSLKKETIKKIIKKLLEHSFETSQFTKKVPEKIYKDIEKEMNEYSTEIKYSLLKTKKEIYENMKIKNEISVSISTYYKLIPKNIIKSKKQTDMCNICNLKTSLEKRKEECESKNLSLPESINNDLKAINQHQDFYVHQNREYKKDINELDNESCIIVIDFKENLKVGGGPIETNNCFYSKKPISLLGFALVFKENNKVKYEYHDFLSQILSHDSLFSGECLISLLKSDKFKKINNIKVWTDNGNHFRSYEFLYYLFKKAPKYIKGSIKYNRFVECHGKSIVDGHFGVISKTLKEKENQLYIRNINDLKNIFEQEEKRKELYNLVLSGSNISQKSFSYIYERKFRPIKKELEVKNLRINLSYLMKDGKLYTSPLTFESFSEYFEIIYCLKSRDDTRKTKISEDASDVLGKVH